MKMYDSGMSDRGGANCGDEHFKRVQLKNDVIVDHSSEIYELDVLYGFIEHIPRTETRENGYVLTMVSRQPRRIAGLSVAFDKSPSRVQQIVDNAPAASWNCTDGWSGYTDVVYPGRHQRNVHDKSGTFTVEGVNADLRHCIPLLARRSRCFAANDGNTVRCHRGVYGGLQPLRHGQAPLPPDPRKGSLPLGLGRFPLISAFGHSPHISRLTLTH